MIFEIGRRQARVALGEDAELARRHRQRAAALHRVFNAHGGAAEQIMVALVERRRTRHLEYVADLQMVLQVLAAVDRRMAHLDAEG